MEHYCTKLMTILFYSRLTVVLFNICIKHHCTKLLTILFYRRLSIVLLGIYMYRNPQALHKTPDPFVLQSINYVQYTCIKHHYTKPLTVFFLLSSNNCCQVRLDEWGLSSPTLPQVGSLVVPGGCSTLMVTVGAGFSAL